MLNHQHLLKPVIDNTKRLAMHSPIHTTRKSLTRRDAICVGGLSAFGIDIDALSAETRISQSNAAKQCILIWLEGGPSHLEMFDPKPEAPEEVRGPLGSIATTIPGIRLNECLSQTANIMDDITLIRSVTSPLGEHNFGTHYLLTGYKPTPALEYPALCSTVVQLREQTGVLPPNIAVPRFSNNLSGNGFLPATTQPFAVGGNPQNKEFKVRDLDFFRGVNLPRIDRRKRLVNALDGFTASSDSAVSGLDSDLERAFNLLASREAKAAFNLQEESVEVRNRYGFGDPIGQSCLLARRLVQRGVSFVTVNSSGWDTHQNISSLKRRFETDRNAKLPSFDRAFSALITDLKQQGMLASTLVLVMGEFGRTPKVNANAGRDHWPRVFSIAMAGGGISGGEVYGASNSLGEYPEDKPVTPADITATVYTLLGINPNHELHTRDGRPVRIAPESANVLSQLLI